MNRKKYTRTKRKNRPFYVILFILVLYIFWIFIDQRIKLYELRQQEEMLKREVAELKKEEARLQQEIQMVNDPKYIEKIARERLKMVMPNEIIYIDMERTKNDEEMWQRIR